MMTNVKNSELLNEIIEFSKNIGKAQTVTAEKFLVALLCGVSKEKTFSGSEFVATVTEKLKSLNITAEQLKSKLLEYIEGGNGSFYDGLYMQKMIFEAKDAVEKEGGESLMPSVLFNKIIDNPSDAIKAAIGENKENVDAQTVQNIVDEILPSDETKDDEEMLAEIRESASKIKAMLDLGKELHVQEEKPSVKEEISKLVDKVKTLQSELLDTVYGQDNAVNVFTTGYFQAELLSMTDIDRKKPRATYLFAGPPGVGKTFLAEVAAEKLSLPFMRFDMSEYADKEANLEFCGSDKVYKNAKSGNVTGFVSEHPKCILLFDEVEKAHLCVIHLFLQMLDAGRLRDNYTDEEVSFKDAIIIFTTNAGKQLYESESDGDFSSLSRKVVLKALRNDINPLSGSSYFPAALCSRFASGNVIMFNHIMAHDLRHIAKKEILRSASNFSKNAGVSVDIDEKVYTALLFSEGGNADARMIKSRAESFFNGEIYELLRLVASDKVQTSISDLTKIEFVTEIDESSEAYNLFFGEEKLTALVFGSDKTVRNCKKVCKDVEIISAKTVDEAKNIISHKDICVILIDLSYGKRGSVKYLNIEDQESVSADMFDYLTKLGQSLPVYVLETSAYSLTEEEKMSLFKEGARDVVRLDDKIGNALKQICVNVYQQQNMNLLAKTNKVVSFTTAQTVSKNGKKATIKLIDFDMAAAVDAEDSCGFVTKNNKPDVDFDDIIGAQDAKSELKYFAEYLRSPKKFAAAGVKMPKGALLYGPPGTGKTMLAKALAAQSGVTFIYTEGNKFLKKYVGEGPEKVHDLFRSARKYAPTIVFIDEIDAIAKERHGDERVAAGEETLTALLAEMDGFNVDSTKPVFVLAATNFDVAPGSPRSLDQALVRRFDRRIYVDLPTDEERKQFMLRKCAKNAMFDISEQDIDNLAVRTVGMSLSDLDSIFEFALRQALRAELNKVKADILDEAFETYVNGEKKNWSEAEVERVARHEAGHAFLCWQSGETPSYLTIVARSDHGGYMQHDSTEKKTIYTKDELLSRIRVALGGRAAEIVCYGECGGVSTGASGDLVSATAIAERIVCSYGMVDECGLAVSDPRTLRSGDVAKEVRKAVNKLLSEQMAQAIEKIRANKDMLDVLSNELMQKSHLSANEISELFLPYKDRINK
ncbi:putative uncharacterized protein [Firmicutes bacterium CAG:552]|nr:putative uncharacterized protein [Firmicutes bacterium CAG:552]